MNDLRYVLRRNGQLFGPYESIVDAAQDAQDADQLGCEVLALMPRMRDWPKFQPAEVVE